MNDPKSRLPFPIFKGYLNIRIYLYVLYPEGSTIPSVIPLIMKYCDIYTLF